MKGNLHRLAQSRFWLICYQILIGNARKLAWATFEQNSIHFQYDVSCCARRSHSHSQGFHATAYPICHELQRQLILTIKGSLDKLQNQP